MERSFNIAIVGATGLVGEAMREILEQREFPVGELYLLAGERSAGQSLQFRDKSHKVGLLQDFDFSQVEIALFSAGSDVSMQYAPIAADAGCVVIDNASCFRYDPDIPLVIPEVNPEMVGEYRNQGIIANPNCSTIQMLMALSPIHREVGIERINVSTYQAVSGSGRKAVEELAGQTARLLNGLSVDPDVYPKQITFNVLPQIDAIQDNGYTREEMKMVLETQKILGDDSIRVNPTCVRVPVFFGHSESLHVETREPISAMDVRNLLEVMPGVEVVDESDEEGGYATPVTEGVGKDEVFVSRIREDISSPSGINMWVVSDNVRKGAALNSIQIAELLIQQYL